MLSNLLIRFLFECLQAQVYDASAWSINPNAVKEDLHGCMGGTFYARNKQTNENKNKSEIADKQIEDWRILPCSLLLFICKRIRRRVSDIKITTQTAKESVAKRFCRFFDKLWDFFHLAFRSRFFDGYSW